MIPNDGVVAGFPRIARWRRIALWIVLAAAIALHALLALRLAGAMGSDFVIFHEAAIRALSDPLALYHPSDARFTLQGYLYPPPSVLLFLPLALGSAGASFLWAKAAIIGCAVLAGALWLALLREDWNLPRNRLEELAVLGLALAIGPLLTVRQGQVDTVILLLCVAPLWLERRGWPRLAGGLIAVGCWIKIYPVLLLFWLLRRPARRALLGGFVAGAVLMPLASLAIVPPELYLDYFTRQLPEMSQRAIINIYNQSLAAIYLRATHPLDLATGTYDALILPAWLRAAIMAGALGTMAAISRHAGKAGMPDSFVAAMAMALVGLIAPLGWGHSYCYVLPLFILALRLAASRDCWGQCAIIAGCWLALLIPAHHRLAFEAALPGWAAQAFYARYALATLVLMALAWRQAAGGEKPAGA